MNNNHRAAYTRVQKAKAQQMPLGWRRRAPFSAAKLLNSQNVE
jgi:hypothetical protein